MRLVRRVAKERISPRGWLLMFAELIGSPMSLYDFYMYLKYIELSPENLEFYLWYVVPLRVAWASCQC